MKIVINGVNDAMEVTPETTLQELLRRFRTFGMQNKQVISKVVLDGELLSEKREAELGATPVTTFERLELETTSLTKMVLSISWGLLETIDLLNEKSRRIGGLLQEGESTEALQMLDQFSHDLSAFSQGITYCFKAIDGNAIDLQVVNEQDLNRVDFEQDLKELKQLLQRVYECLQADEEVEFADILNFEIPGNLERWRTVLSTLSTILKKECNVK